MFLQKKKEIADLIKQYKTGHKEEHEAGQAKAKPDWFLKTCGIGLILLGLWKIDQYPLYTLIFVIIGVAACFAAHGEPPKD
jgi:hypothetical protein